MKHGILPIFSSNNHKYTEFTAQRGRVPITQGPASLALSSGNSWEHKLRFYLSTVILSKVYYDWDLEIYLWADGSTRNF